MAEGKWTKESAINFMMRNGHTVSEKGVELKNPGIGAWGCADYLRKKFGFHITLAKK